MIQHFHLPDLGEGLTEAELVQWMVAPGESVRLNQAIAEVETAKAVVELPSPYAGVVRELQASPGEAINVGAVIISFDVETDGPAPLPNLVGYGAPGDPAGAPRRRARRAEQAAPPSTTASPGTMAEPAASAEVEHPRAAPLVRRIARERGIDLSLIRGSGPNGRISRADVEAASVAPASQPPDDRVTRVPIRGVRKATAAAMVRSAFTAPHVTTFLTLDVTATTELLTSLRADKGLEGHRIGILAFVAKAVCLALATHPSLNATWDEDAGDIVLHHYVNLGIATATERGLIVPHIKNADAMTLVELADALGSLTTTARGGKTDVADMIGGTFSISNIGVFGVDSGTPVLNPGEAGILALGAVRRQPWEYQGQIALRDVTTLALSFDHRVVDGEQGAKFLADVGAVLREPGRAMLLG